MLEAPNEGDWGLFVEDIFFDKAVEAGFDHIRVPVSWTHHAQSQPPYTIDTEFMERVEYVVDEAISHGLKVLLNNHHYDQLNDDPNAEWNRALALWQQIATRFQNRAVDQLYFEILNEPHGQFNDQPELWNQFMVDALSEIRQTNETRKVVVGPVFWNSIRGLASFSPPKDENLIGTIHFYDPFEFTHQGATWVDPIPPVGTMWDGDQFDILSPLQNWSWDTEYETSHNGLLVTHNSGWSGLQVHSPQPISNSQSVEFTVDQAMNLTISVTDINSGGQYQQTIQTLEGTNSYSIDVSSFGKSGFVTNIIIQNQSSEPLPPYLLSDFRLRTNHGTVLLIGDARSSIWSAMRTAARWGLENAMPIYLGEFGAYSLADMDSRVRWTTTVRQSAEFMNFDWAYWELAAGFGIYDPNDDQWRLELLQSLIPEFK